MRSVPLKPTPLYIRSSIFLAVVSALYGIGLLPAYADNPSIQDESDAVAIPDIRVIGEVIPTNTYSVESSHSATGLDLSLRQTPQSITVINKQRIKDQHLDNMGKILDQTTGISHSQYGSATTGYTQFYSRGYMIHNRTIDGVFYSTQGLSSQGINAASSAAYDNVAVVRGATGLLTGIGDPSGSISLDRKRPTKETQIEASVTAGNWKRFSTEIDASGALNASQTLRARGVLNYYRGNTWQDRAFDDGGIVYAVVAYDLAPNTTVTTSVEYEKIHSKGSVQHAFSVEDSAGNLAPFGKHTNAAAKWAFFNHQRYNFFGSLQHQFTDKWQAKVDYSYNKIRFKNLYGVMTGDIDVTTNMGGATTGYTDGTSRQHSISLALKGEYTLFSRQHELMLGFGNSIENSDGPSYKRVFVQVPNAYQFNGDIFRSAFSVNGEYHSLWRQIGGYAVTRLHPSDKLAVILGTRIGSWKTWSKTVYGSSGIHETGIITPYAGVVYDISEPISIYASYTSIFNPQNAKDRYGTILKPEKGSNVEVGLKGEFFDKRLNTSLAIFESRQDNLAVSDEPYKIPGTDDDASRAEDNTKGRGFEIEVQGAITPDWQLQAGYNFNSIKNSDGQLLSTSIPRQQFKLFTSYRLPVLNQALTLGGGLRWQSKIYEEGSWIINPANYVQKAYTVVDLMARYRIRKDLDLSVNIGNVFNTTYYSTTGELSYGATRNISATLRYQF